MQIKNCCPKCGGLGLMNRPDAKWWHFFYWRWCKTTCDLCGGDGYAKPPGWPDQEEMRRRRPKPPGPPPNVRPRCAWCRGEIDPPGTAVTGKHGMKFHDGCAMIACEVVK